VGSGGVLSAVSGSPVAAGAFPSAIAANTAGSYLYVTDFASGNVLGFAINGGSLTAVNGSPFPAGNQPSAIVVDPDYPFAYVANSMDNTITAFSISNGILTWIGSKTAGGGTYSTGPQPVAIGIDPSTNHYLYTANFLGGNMSSFELSPTDGTLINSQFSPYASNAQPTAIAAIPHGSSTSK
jgi:DNA-binding beta-propeller fold protein YncE